VIRRGAALAAILLLVPAPAYAHAVGPGSGVEIELLLVAGVLLVGGIKLRQTPERFTVGNLLITIGALGIAASLVVPNLGSTAPTTTSARISIVSPSDGDEVDAGEVAVEVDVKNGSVATSASDTEGGHIHIFVDDAMVSMPYTTDSSVELTPGEHTITVEYVGTAHQSFEPRVTDEVTVEAR
jgi:hypothetical protein